MRLLLFLLFLFVLSCRLAFADAMAECKSVMTPGNESRAYNACLPAAREGNPEAQTLVGMALMTGVGVFKDPDTAVAWFQLAANQKYAPGLYELALAKMAGMGTATDENGGMLLMQKAAVAGNREAQDFLQQVGAPLPETKPQPKKIPAGCNGVGCGRPMGGLFSQ